MAYGAVKSYRDIFLKQGGAPPVMEITSHGRVKRHLILAARARSIGRSKKQENGASGVVRKENSSKTVAQRTGWSSKERERRHAGKIGEQELDDISLSVHHALYVLTSYCTTISRKSSYSCK